MKSLLGLLEGLEIIHAKLLAYRRFLIDGSYSNGKVYGKPGARGWYSLHTIAHHTDCETAPTHWEISRWCPEPQKPVMRNYRCNHFKAV